MRKKNKLAKPTLAESKSAIAFGAAFLLMCVGAIYAVYHVSSSRSVRPDLNQVPVYFKQAKDAMPFPQTLDPAQFQIANVREAYSVAKEIPDVLAQQPCYCYCQRQGGFVEAPLRNNASGEDIRVEEKSNSPLARHFSRWPRDCRREVFFEESDFL